MMKTEIQSSYAFPPLTHFFLFLHKKEKGYFISYFVLPYSADRLNVAC